MVTKIENSDRIEYRNDKGELHRVDGPAREFINGTKEWWLNGLCHREEGPAVEWSYGTKEWYINDKRHREDGPAYIGSNGCMEWYLNGKSYSEQDWQQEVINIKLERLRNYGN